MYYEIELSDENNKTSLFATKNKEVIEAFKKLSNARITKVKKKDLDRHAQIID